MSDRYLIDLRLVTLISVTVEADTAAEAEERAMAGHGEAGDPMPSDPEIIAVRLLEG